jgi:hypothetical protein
MVPSTFCLMPSSCSSRLQVRLLPSGDLLWSCAKPLFFFFSFFLSEDEQLPLNVVRPFELHVPNTNFPPKTSSRFSSEMQSGEVRFVLPIRVRSVVSDGVFVLLATQMISHESEFQYYFQFALHNGSMLHYPAGKAGFLPFSSADVKDDVKSTTEKVVVNLETPRHGAGRFRWAAEQQNGLRCVRPPETTVCTL